MNRVVTVHKFLVQEKLIVRCLTHGAFLDSRTPQYFHQTCTHKAHADSRVYVVLINNKNLH